MLPAQSKSYTFNKGDFEFLLDIVEAVLPRSAQHWDEVVGIYNSGVSIGRQRCADELRTEFRLVCSHSC
jgi:hypothetical protein